MGVLKLLLVKLLLDKLTQKYRMDKEYLKNYSNFIKQLKFAENYHVPYLLDSTSAIISNPILDNFILPSLLYVRMVSLFDEGLSKYLGNKNLILPKKQYKDDLNGRLKFFADRTLLAAPNECHRIRKRRNEVAHEHHRKASWKEVRNDLPIIEFELQKLGLIDKRPDYKFYAERSGANNSDDPDAEFEFVYSFGLKEQNKKCVEVSWKSKVMKE